MIDNTETAIQIEAQLNVLAEGRVPKVRFCIAYGHNALEQKRREDEEAIIVGVLVPLNAGLTPIQRLENFFQTLTFSLAVKKEYIRIVEEILEDWCKDIAGAEVVQGEYAGIVNADMPQVGTLDVISGLGQAAIISTTLYYQFIRNGVLSNQCVYKLDGTAFLATQAAINKISNLATDARENDSGLTTVVETQGLTFSLTFPYIKAEGVLNVVNEILNQDKIIQPHKLEYCDGAACGGKEAKYNVYMQSGTISAPAGTIPTIEATFVIAQAQAQE